MAVAPLVKDFNTLYPGITVEYNDMNSTELYNRFISETAAGGDTADALWSSAMDLQMKLAAGGYAMDGFDLLILGFMLAAIRADLGLSPAQGGSILTWTLIGAGATGVYIYDDEIDEAFWPHEVSTLRAVSMA